MDAMDEYIGKKLKNYSNEHQASRNVKLRLLQAARYCNPSRENNIERKAVIKREVDVGYIYDLIFPPVDILNISSLQWGMSNIRVVM